MEKYIINGGNKLYGSVKIQSAKNSVLPILAGAILTDKKVILKNVPQILDVKNMVKILTSLGCSIVYDEDNLIIDSSKANCFEIPSELAHELRSSVFLLGSVVSRFHFAKIAYPGGCDIGLRPIDLHLNGLKKLGVEITEKDGYIFCKCKKLKGSEITLNCPSVGATENIMLGSVMAEGTTIIRNAAREPEIVDLQNFLNSLGAKVCGGGSSTVKIVGVTSLDGCEYQPILDRIEAGTFMIATAMCQGEVSFEYDNYKNLKILIDKLVKNGCKVGVFNGKIVVENHNRLISTKFIETKPYPGFPTDLQAQYASLSGICLGQTKICENLFETRYKYVPELIKMGGDIVLCDRCAFINGVEKYRGATVVARDLRGGAALVLAGLSADGMSEVIDISHIDRGYASLEYKLKTLGADIVRVSV